MFFLFLKVDILIRLHIAINLTGYFCVFIVFLNKVVQFLFSVC